MQYFITVIDDGQAEAAGATNSASAAEAAAIDVFNDTLRANGNWIFAAGLAAPSSGTVIDNRGDSVLITDGPFLASKEYAAGFWIIEAADFDAALRLASEGSKACNRKLELRALLHEA